MAQLSIVQKLLVQYETLNEGHCEEMVGDDHSRHSAICTGCWWKLWHGNQDRNCVPIVVSCLLSSQRFNVSVPAEDDPGAHAG